MTIFSKVPAICLVLTLLILIPAAAQTNVISAGWYPQFPAVDAGSADFAYVEAWLSQKSGLAAPKLVSYPFIYPGKPELKAPAVLEFVCGKTTVDVDAVLTFVSPSAALADIQQACGLPVVSTVFVKPIPPATPAPQPAKPMILVGDAIPGQVGWFQPVYGDDSPPGTRYADSRGTFVKYAAPTPFGPSVRWKLVE